MSDPFTIVPGQFGPRLIVTGMWARETRAAIDEWHVRELELNYTKGWKGDDLRFLEGVDLDAFELTDWNIRDVSPIHFLVGLKRLAVNTYCRTELRFGEFPQLEDCAFEWRPKARSIFDKASLRVLFINKYPGEDLIEFSRMAGLTRLSLASPKVETCAGVAALSRLEFLGLYEAKKLIELRDLEQLKDLVGLEINGAPRIEDLSAIASLSRLEELQLCDDPAILSIAGFEKLNSLKRFLFYGSTNIRDGDLSPIARMHGLEKAAFMNRRHYCHRAEELNQLLEKSASR